MATTVTGAFSQIRRQEIPALSKSGTGYGAGRPVLFGQLYLVTNDKHYFVGGVQVYGMREINNTSYAPSAGTDWNEKVIGQRLWQGSMTRWAPRGFDIKQILRKAHSGTGDIDFRFIEFDIMYDYDYTEINGGKGIDHEAWVYHGVTVVSYGPPSVEGPTGLLMETADIICRGETKYQGGTVAYSNYPGLYGGSLKATTEPPTLPTLGTA